MHGRRVTISQSMPCISVQPRFHGELAMWDCCHNYTFNRISGTGAIMNANDIKTEARPNLVSMELGASERGGEEEPQI